ncbi:hypothetical protein BJX70DRAFT_93434 [Aspergillus crustosus]
MDSSTARPVLTSLALSLSVIFTCLPRDENDKALRDDVIVFSICIKTLSIISSTFSGGLWQSTGSNMSHINTTGRIGHRTHSNPGQRSLIERL